MYMGKSFRLSPDDIKTSEQDPLNLFYFGIKSKETQRTMGGSLRRFLVDVCADILDGSLRERAKQFVDIARKDQEKAVQILLAYTKLLKARTILEKSDKNYLNPSSVPNRIKPIKKLLEMNGVGLGWKRIYSTFPEEDNTHRGRGYTRDEIKILLEHSDGLETDFIILAFCSGGIRVGAWEGMRWECVFPVYQHGDEFVMTPAESTTIVCGAMIVYKGTRDEYIALISKEAWNKLELYKKEWMRLMNREPKDEDPLLLERYKKPKPMTVCAVRTRIEKLVAMSGLRTKQKGKRRYEVPVTHGFRRFWDKVMMETSRKSDKLSTLVKKERLLGHDGIVKTDKNYYWTDIMDLVSDYLIAMPELTINDEQRLRQQLESENTRVDELAKLRREREYNAIRLDELEAKVQRISKYQLFGT